MDALIAKGYLLKESQGTTDGISRLIEGGWGYFGFVTENNLLNLSGCDVDHEVGQIQDCCFGWDSLYVLPSSSSPGTSVRRYRLEESNSGLTMGQIGSIEVPSWCHVRSISAGESHLLLLMEDGSLWSWGENRNGCLGIGDERESSTVQCILGPCCEEEKSTFTAPVVSISCGLRHSCAINSDGIVFCWGSNLRGECGDCSKEDVVMPKPVDQMGGLVATAVSAGLHHTLVITDSGDAYGWGSNVEGQLGLSPRVSHSPTLIDSHILEEEVLTKVSCGSRHSLVLSQSGRCFGWGWNKFKQVSESDLIIADVRVIAEGCSDVAAGRWHSLLLRSPAPF